MTTLSRRTMLTTPIGAGSLGATLRPVLAEPASPARTILTRDLNLYVNSAVGNDTNDGLSLRTPFKTLQRAWDILQQDYDLNGIHNATINAADGVYASFVANGPIRGLGRVNGVSFVGNPYAPTNCRIEGGDCIVVIQGASIWLYGFKVSGHRGIWSYIGGAVFIRGRMEFGVCTEEQLRAEAGGMIGRYADYQVSGNAPIHMAAFSHGRIITPPREPIRIDVTGTPAFKTGFAVATTLGLIIDNSEIVGKATGVRYRARSNGVIDTGPAMARADFYPGDVAGSTDSGGQYTWSVWPEPTN